MLQGLSVSPGVAVGRAVIIRFGGLPAFRRAVAPEELDREERRLRRAAAKAAEDFGRHSRESKGDMGSELAAILEAHGLIADDETYLGAIVERIRRERVNAEWALAEVTRELGTRLAAADSAAMREREADIADVAREIARAPVGRGTPRARGAAARLDPRGRRALAGRRRAPRSPARPRARPRARRTHLARLDHRPVLRASRRRRDPGPLRAGLARATDRRRRGPRDRRSRPLPSGRFAGASSASARTGRRAAACGAGPRAPPSRRTASGSPCAPTSSFPRRSRPSSDFGPKASASSAPSFSTCAPCRTPRESRSSATPTRRSSRPPHRTPSSFAPTTSAARRGSARRPVRTRPSGCAACATASPIPSSSRSS